MSKYRNFGIAAIIALGASIATVTTVRATRTSSGCDPATADGVNDACACEADYKTYCLDIYRSSDVGRKIALVACAKDHSASLSDACLAATARRSVLTDTVNVQCGDARYVVAGGTDPAVGNNFGNEALCDARSKTVTYKGATGTAEVLFYDCYVALRADFAAEPSRSSSLTSCE